MSPRTRCTGIFAIGSDGVLISQFHILCRRVGSVKYQLCPRHRKAVSEGKALAIDLETGFPRPTGLEPKE